MKMMENPMIAIAANLPCCERGEMSPYPTVQIVTHV
jgi:hypothetical protein